MEIRELRQLQQLIEEAQAEAVRQMGDPVTVGQELDRVAADLLEPGGWLHAGDIRRQRQAVDAGDEA